MFPTSSDNLDPVTPNHEVFSLTLITSKRGENVGKSKFQFSFVPLTETLEIILCRDNSLGLFDVLWNSQESSWILCLFDSLPLWNYVILFVWNSLGILGMFWDYMYGNFVILWDSMGVFEYLWDSSGILWVHPVEYILEVILRNSLREIQESRSQVHLLWFCWKGSFHTCVYGLVGGAALISWQEIPIRVKSGRKSPIWVKSGRKPNAKGSHY